MKGWYGNSQKHSLASKGIRSKTQNNNIQYKNLYNLVEKFRLKEEKICDFDFDNTIFKGMCQDITKKLVEYLKENGFKNVIRVAGYYQDVYDDFEPDMTNWSIDEQLEFEDTFDNKWSHWWVEVDNKWIVDISADQFHYNKDQDEYRIVITDINDNNYEAI